MPTETARTLGDYLVGLVAAALLMLWYSRDVKLTLAIMAGLGVTVALGMALAMALLRGGRLVGMSAGSIWRLALAGLQRRGAANAIQVVIFSMAIMLLLVLVLVVPADEAPVGDAVIVHAGGRGERIDTALHLGQLIVADSFVLQQNNGPLATGMIDGI